MFLEVRLLLRQQFLGVVFQVGYSLQRQLTRDLVFVLVRRLPQNTGPSLRGGDELGKDLPQIFVAAPVVVEIVLELVHCAGNFFHVVVDVLGTPLRAGIGDHPLNSVDPGLNYPAVGQNTLRRIHGSFADCFDLRLRQIWTCALSGQGPDRQTRETEHQGQEPGPPARPSATSCRNHRLLVYFAKMTASSDVCAEFSLFNAS